MWPNLGPGFAAEGCAGGPVLMAGPGRSGSGRVRWRGRAGRCPWRTVGAENLCHQAIFMNHAGGAVAPPDAEVVEVGDAVGQRAEWRGLAEGSVWPVGVAG